MRKKDIKLTRAITKSSGLSFKEFILRIRDGKDVSVLVRLGILDLETLQMEIGRLLKQVSY